MGEKSEKSVTRIHSLNPVPTNDGKNQIPESKNEKPIKKSSPPPPPPPPPAMPKKGS